LRQNKALDPTALLGASGKDELLGTASFLSKKKSQKQWRGSSYAKVEQKIMISFYSIRKLMDANKLTKAIVNLDIPALEYIATGKKVTLFNNHKIDILYKLDEPKTKSVMLRFLCNQMVHSYIFMIVTSPDSNGLNSILVNSADIKDKRLLSVSVDTLIHIFESVGQNYPWKSKFKYDESKGDYKVVCE
jgi:hypothetical protein